MKMKNEEFIKYYFDDYVKMAYRKLNKKVDVKKETILIKNLYYLLDNYAIGELSDYIHYNKIV